MTESEGGARPSSWLISLGLPLLTFWLIGGLVLEALHGFKVAPYLEDELRRELWTLAHAHGTLFSAVSIVLGIGLPRWKIDAQAARRIDRLFAIGAAILPWGFFLGGTVHPETDPNLAILLVPAGGALAAVGLGLLCKAWFTSHERRS